MLATSLMAGKRSIEILFGHTLPKDNIATELFSLPAKR